MPAPATSPMEALRAALPHLRRYAVVLTGDDHEADGLVMETLERAHEEALPEATGPNLRARLFALMHELHAGHASARHAASIEDKPAAAGADAKTATSESGQSSGLLMRFRNLTSEEREILLLVAVERMSYEEIASLVRAPVSTVMTRLKRARDVMRAVDIRSDREPVHD